MPIDVQIGGPSKTPETELQMKERLARQALYCLHIAVEPSIANDVWDKVLAWTDALEASRDNLRICLNQGSKILCDLRDAIEEAFPVPADDPGSKLEAPKDPVDDCPF